MYLVPSWERARTQPTKNTTSGLTAIKNLSPKVLLVQKGKKASQLLSLVFEVPVVVVTAAGRGVVSGAAVACGR